MYRFFPSQDSKEHYTAVVQDKSILQVKPFQKTAFDTLEAWCASLPGSPSTSQLTYTLPSKSNPIRQTPVDWKVPRKNPAGRDPMNWASHIYKMIAEANPTFLERTDIRDAYHHLVEVLEKNKNSMLATYLNYEYMEHSIECFMNDPNVKNKLYQVLIEKRLDHHPVHTRHSISPIHQEIIDAYLPLYQLIGEHVVSYMKRKEKYIADMKRLKRWQRLEKTMQRRISNLQQYLGSVQKLIQDITQTM